MNRYSPAPNPIEEYFNRRIRLLKDGEEPPAFPFVPMAVDANGVPVAGQEPAGLYPFQSIKRDLPIHSKGVPQKSAPQKSAYVVVPRPPPNKYIALIEQFDFDKGMLASVMLKVSQMKESPMADHIVYLPAFKRWFCSLVHTKQEVLKEILELDVSPPAHPNRLLEIALNHAMSKYFDHSLFAIYPTLPFGCGAVFMLNTSFKQLDITNLLAYIHKLHKKMPQMSPAAVDRAMEAIGAVIPGYASSRSIPLMLAAMDADMTSRFISAVKSMQGFNGSLSGLTEDVIRTCYERSKSAGATAAQSQVGSTAKYGY